MRPFYDPVWSSRLQILWVLFTGAYLIIGALTEARVVSSILAVIGGVLITAVFAHVLLEDQLERLQSLLLIAMAACLFLAHESAKTFSDYLATIFASIFALMVMRLLWAAESTQRLQLLKYRYFCTMSLVLISATFGLLVILDIQWQLS